MVQVDFRQRPEKETINLQARIPALISSISGNVAGWRTWIAQHQHAANSFSNDMPVFICRYAGTLVEIRSELMQFACNGLNVADSGIVVLTYTAPPVFVRHHLFLLRDMLFLSVPDGASD